jgi:hypothetical protein
MNKVSYIKGLPHKPLNLNSDCEDKDKENYCYISIKYDDDRAGNRKFIWNMNLYQTFFNGRYYLVEYILLYNKEECPSDCDIENYDDFILMLSGEEELSLSCGNAKKISLKEYMSELSANCNKSCVFDSDPLNDINKFHISSYKIILK